MLDEQKSAPDERTFWRKVKRSAKKLGEEIAVTGIKSWLAMTDSQTSVRHKAILGGALAYFVLPTDMVPDVLAGVGFTDDMAAMTLAANTVGNAITEQHEQAARDKWDSMGE
ncbi:YkvA family protein [Vibrio renipiscarius]|nr:YkvA family protein [Vibrio renipiscarius]